VRRGSTRTKTRSFHRSSRRAARLNSHGRSIISPLVSPRGAAQLALLPQEAALGVEGAELVELVG
jgi:hypothetical protein